MADFQLNVKINGIEQTLQSVGDLEKALQATNEQLKGVEANSKEFSFLTNQAKNISNVFNAVTDSAEGFSKSLNDVNQSAKNLGTTVTSGTNVAAELKSASSSATKLNSDVKTAATSTMNLRTELRQVTIELQGLEPGSARFQELSVRAGELRDQISDTNTVINSLAGSATERLGKALTGVASIGIGAFQGVAGAAALFGVESEQAQQVMVKLQALMNLSQAIQSFGQFGDTITTIKAGLMSLVPSTTAATIGTTALATAEGAEAVAATGAAVGTGAFAAALNALPLVAIVTALGLAVAALINWASASGDTEEAEKKRTEELEKQKAAIDSVTESTATEGSELLLLLNQLKQTNAGSKERSKLIKEINTNYGTSIQNLKDEKQFQDQVNTSVKDYIIQLKNKVALQLVEQELSKLLQERIGIERELDNQQKINNQSTYLAGIRVNTLSAEQESLNRSLGITTDAFQGINYQINSNIEATAAQAQVSANSSAQQIKDLNARKNNLDAQIQDLATEATSYQKLLTGAFEKIETGSKNTGNSLDDLKNKQQKVIDDSIAFTEYAINKEDELTKLRLDQTTNKIDNLDYETNKELDAAKKKYDIQKKAIEDNKFDEKTKFELLKKLNEDYQAYLITQNEIYSIRENQIISERLKNEKKLYADIALANEILQSEIRFGNNDTADSLEGLQNRLTQLRINELDQQLKSNTLSNEDYQKKLDEKLVLQGEYNARALKISYNTAEAQKNVELATTIQGYEERLGATITYNEETKKYELENTKEKQDELSKLDKVAQDDRLVAEQAALDAISTTEINLNKETNVKKAEADAKYLSDSTQAVSDSETIILNIRLNKMREFFAVAQSSIAMLAEGINSAFGGTIQATITAIQGFTELSNKEFGSTTEKIAAYAEVIGQALNAVVGAFVQQNKEALDKDLQQFQSDSNTKKDILTNQYNQGLIDKEAYDKGLKNLDKNLKASELEARKKAFEKEKSMRIAQATIAGLTGAVSAFAGAMTIPPPAGPIIGGILAALVAATTAVNISQIKKQQFDAGGTTVTAEGPGAASSAVSQINAASSGGFTSFNEGVTGSPTGTTTTTGGTTGMYQKVYVLESDITNSQNRVRTLESNASFG